MKLRLMLSTATALGLLMGGSALANDNESYVDQFSAGANTGRTNSALVDQSGGSDNVAGTASRNIRQTTTSGQINNDGSYKNTLTIVQGGSNNSVGTGINANIHGNEPAQHGVYQRNNYGSLWGASTNSLDVEQKSDNNTVGAAFQSIGSRVGSNEARIVQDGTGGHTVASLTQRQNQSTVNDTVNSIEIVQTGSQNTVARVEQYSGGVVGSYNVIDANIGGSNNGNRALTGFAALSGATTSSLLQGEYVYGVGHFTASNSSIILDISGSDNAFGSSQFGDRNTVGTLSITGDWNQVGTYQRGDRNEIALAAVAGEYNDIGIRQLGHDNFGDVEIDGDSNGLEVSQNGNDNRATVKIKGDGNGAFNTFSGAALAVAGLARPSGLVAQLGNDNAVDLNITGDLNAFTLEQAGNNNTIGSTVIGNSNQLAVVQAGNSNSAFTSQIGSNNNIGISQ